MRVVAIIPAAGAGRRMGSAVEKQFLHLRGIPILARTLRVFDQSPEVDGISSAKPWRVRFLARILVKSCFKS